VFRYTLPSHGEYGLHLLDDDDDDDDDGNATATDDFVESGRQLGLESATSASANETTVVDNQMKANSTFHVTSIVSNLKTTLRR
jgi:hypothetical protein